MVGVTVSGDARAHVLARIRAALGPAPPVPEPVPRRPREGPAPPRVLAHRLGERLADYGAAVHETDAPRVPDVVTRLLDGERCVVAPGLPRMLDAVSDDPPLTPLELDAIDAVLTGCALAIAETGTIVLDGGPASGRRAISLIPDHHVCIVEAAQIVSAVPDAITALRPAVLAGRPLTLVSGPSATSDIELERVEGVHGPRRLDVILVAAGDAR